MKKQLVQLPGCKNPCIDCWYNTMDWEEDDYGTCKYKETVDQIISMYVKDEHVCKSWCPDMMWTIFTKEDMN